MKYEEQFTHQAFEVLNTISTNPEAIEALNKLFIHGYDSRTGGMVDIDLITRKIFAKKSVQLVDAEHGIVESDDMYSKIIESHAELSEALHNAVPMGESTESASGDDHESTTQDQGGSN